MHASVMAWAADQVDRHALAGLSVLEVGSLDVNGSVRSLFSGEYLGVDMRDGPGVDQVVNAHALEAAFPPDRRAFDVVVSTEMLEHDAAPWVSVEQMRRVSRDDAWLLLTARGYDERGCFEVHDYPDDLWRFSVNGMRHLLARCGWRAVSVAADPECPGVLAVATVDA